MKHSLALIVENRPGVLTHISGLISRRGFNIDSIAASSTEQPDITRISLVVEVESKDALEQIIAQIEKLVQIIAVIDLTSQDHISRELALIKVAATPAARADISSLADIFRAKIVDVNPESLVIELTGEGKKIDAFCKMMEKHGIIEIIRTGEIFLSRQPESAIKAAEKIRKYN